MIRLRPGPALVRALSALVCSFLALSLAASASAQEVVPPRLLGAPVPPYPAGAEGSAEVRLDVVVEADGSVGEVRLVEAPEGPFDEAAVAFVRSLSFEPALVDGEAVPVEIEYRVRFEPPVAEEETAEARQAEGDAAEVKKAARVAEAKAGATEGVKAGAVSDEAEAGGASNGAPDASDDDDDDGYEAEIIGKRAPPAPDGAGDYVMKPQVFAAVPRRSAESLLTLAPGLLLRNHQGDGHASAVFLRGFDAGEGQDIEFLLDGVPLNEVSNPHGHGYADTHFIIPELVEEVRVVEGPFDPAQGDFAVAGTAAYRLGLPERGLRIEGGYGSWNAQELLLLWGPEEEPAGTFVGARLRRGDGFGINRAYSGATAMAGFERQLARRTRLRLVGYTHATRFDSAGVIRLDDYEARRLPCAGDADSQFYCTEDANQGGSGSRHGAYALIERRTVMRDLRQLAFFSTRRLRLRENFTGVLLDPERRGDGTEQLYQATTLGLRGELELRRDLLGHGQRLEVGYDARYDDGTSSMRRLRRTGGEPYARVFDNEIRITHLGAWTALRLRLLDWLAVQAGVRIDSFYFDVVDRNRPTETRAGPREPTESLGADGVALQPRVGTQVRLGAGFEWLTSYGAGVRSSDAAALSDGEFAPFARVRAAETGLVWRLEGERSFVPGARLLGFVTHVDRDLVFDERTARNVFLGASSRHGAQLAASLVAPRWLDVAASLTWAEANLTPEGGGFWSLGDGPRLPYIPRWVGRVDATVRGAVPIGGELFPARAGVGATWVGARPLPLETLGEPYATIDLGGSIRFGMVEAGLSIENLLDARYHQAEFRYASNFGDGAAAPSRVPVTHFAAAPPRSVFATIAVVVDPEPSKRPAAGTQREVP